MRVLYFYLFILLVSAPLQAQVRIDSLPMQGILLDKGWRWHAGDNPDFAKPNFDDSKWERIDPTQNIIDLPQIPLAGQVFWLRCKFSVDSSSLQPMVMQLEQSGATKIFLDGKQILAFGNSDKGHIKAINPVKIPLSSPIYVGGQYVLSVRYVCEPNIHYSIHFANTCALFKLRFLSPEGWYQAYKWKQYDKSLNIIVSSFFICLSFLYIAFFIFFPNRKTSLYFVVYTITYGLPYLLSSFLLDDLIEVAGFYWLSNIGIILGIIGYMCIQMALHNQFNQKKGVVFWLFAVLSLLSIVLSFCYYRGWEFYGIVVNFLGSFAIMWLGIKGIQQRRTGAAIIAVGGGFFFIFWISFLLSNSLLGLNALLNPFFYALSQISIPIATAIFVGHDLAQTNNSLQQQLAETNKLAREKQQILTTQNETLERQVTERTAELKHKNRDLEIEAALERVRSRTMAMQHSEELTEAANLLFQQVQVLGIPVWSCGYNIFEKNANECIGWMSTEGTLQPPFSIPLSESPTFIRFYESKQKGEEFYVETVEGDALEAHYKYMLSLPDFKEIAKTHVESGFIFPTFQMNHVVNFKHGNLIFITGEPIPESHEILKRFANVFEQTYTRFLDLQKAEAQAREAQIEASLERIRSRAMAMNTSEELNTLIGFIYAECTKLNMLLDRGFIMTFDKATKDAHWWMVSADASDTPLKILVKYHEYAPNLAILKGWEEREQRWSYVLEGNNKKTWDDYQFANALSQLPDFVKDNMRSVESVILNASFQNFGCIMLSSFEPLSEEHFSLLIRLSKVFELTYTRFLDLQLKEQNAIKLLEEKQKLEYTLTELRSTQTQLIQKEKLASLGELTAGIAHEIQNPLNFVNNFSELSVDLAQELNAELDKEPIDKEFVKELMGDLTQNQEKINHHGKRASSIVKGMLEHSRMGTGERELVNINDLADEYLRLSYHGLRAKDKSFNAKMVTDFDTTLEPIKLVPQEIGRVLLNLINNAFYAVTERKKQSPEHEPTVWVSTKRLDEEVRITVRDNGTGIPDAIRQKIFQPFFTTKPTGEGTGLGLSLSYDIVTKGHGGNLQVESEEGNGTTFIVTLPC
ncbi:MAG: ATP-binding protein [Spirosomataceae bacterium]